MTKNLENWWKSMKIANIDREILHNFWTTWRISIKFSEKRWYDIWCFKSHKKSGFHSLFRKYIFGRTTGQRAGCQIDLIVVLRLDIKHLRKYFDKLYPLLRNRCSVGKKLQRLFSFASPVPVLICAGKYPCNNFYGYRILD